ncbi:DUF732 domain-containing protein [uncultured Mycolicibacterium sp.]|uniref:DUF732 domain-containing protein n=1 Tax=uncultured Mycolicibacterium sp. TaxID=2320817 RepID=UPI00262D35D8|nr:DUF732 domain-containing protein [uncultured Mycolicibacterium sp.]
MIRALLIPAVLAAAALGLPATAAADEESFLQLRERFPFLTAEQLLTEGYRVCQVTRAGTTSSDAVVMVQRDLAPAGISMSAALDIVLGAVVELC